MFKVIRLYLFFMIFFAFNAFSQSELNVEVFSTQNTSFYPEINLLIRNDSEDIRNVIVKFSLGESSPLMKNNGECKLSLRDFDASYRNSIANKFYSDVGVVKQTAGIVPRKGFIHRVYVFGLNNVSYPCVLSYEVIDRDSGKMIKSGGVAVDKKSKLVGSAHEPDTKSFDFDYVVEKVVGKQDEQVELLATLLIKNKTSEFFSLKIASKRLVDCTKTFLGTSLFQGLDGLVMLMRPMSYGAAMTLLYSGLEENSACSLELELIDVSHQFKKLVKIPLKAIGEYDLMEFPTPD